MSNRPLPDLPPGWTAADESELALLVTELVDSAWPHRFKPGFHAALAAATQVVLDWRRRRELLSLAVHLRARQDIAQGLDAEGFAWAETADGRYAKIALVDDV